MVDGHKQRSTDGGPTKEYQQQPASCKLRQEPWEVSPIVGSGRLSSHSPTARLIRAITSCG